MGLVSDIKDFWPKVYFEELERKGFLVYNDFVLTKEYVKDNLKYNSSKAIRKLKIPVLLIYGEEDDIVSPSEGIKFQKLYNGKDLTLKILKDLNHYFYGRKVKEKVLKITFDWIKKRFC